MFVEKVKLNQVVAGSGADLLDQPIVFVLVGPPGSGKSTWAQTTFGWDVYDNHVVSTDYFVDVIAQKKGKTYDQVWKSAIKVAEKQMRERLQSLAKSNHLIIWDQTNLTLKKRRRILSSIPKKYKKFAVVFETNMDTIRSRLDSRSKEIGKTIPNKVLDDMMQLYSPVEEMEGFDNVIMVSDS